MWQFLDISSDWLYNIVAYPSRGIEATGLQTESSLQQTANYSCKASMTEILHLHIIIGFHKVSIPFMDADIMQY